MEKEIIISKWRQKHHISPKWRHKPSHFNEMETKSIILWKCCRQMMLENRQNVDKKQHFSKGKWPFHSSLSVAYEQHFPKQHDLHQKSMCHPNSTLHNSMILAVNSRKFIEFYVFRMSHMNSTFKNRYLLLMYNFAHHIWITLSKSHIRFEQHFQASAYQIWTLLSKNAAAAGRPKAIQMVWLFVQITGTGRCTALWSRGGAGQCWILQQICTKAVSPGCSPGPSLKQYIKISFVANSLNNGRRDFSSRLWHVSKTEVGDPFWCRSSHFEYFRA